MQENFRPDYPEDLRQKRSEMPVRLVGGMLGTGHKHNGDSMERIAVGFFLNFAQQLLFDSPFATQPANRTSR